MDPLSVAASVAGLVAAATSITKTLSALSEPPRLIRSVAAETSALSAIFAQLNGILRSNNNSHTRRERMSMTTVEQFVAILTHCVLTFSELEQEMDGLGVGNTLWDRVKWNSKTDIVREILADLQAQKVSLGLMIGIWSCKTHMQALNSYEQLCQSMTKLSEREQSRRRSLGNSTPTEPPDPTIPRLNVHIHSFSSTLSKSHRASLLSVVSLSQVQDITALSLPLYSCEIYNSAQYNFFPHASRKRIQVRPMSAIFSWTERSLVTRVASRLWRQNAKGMDISAPYDLMHNTHIGMHPESGKMMIWGDETPETVVAKKVGWIG